MAKFNSPVDILKLLDSSNCRKCNKPTCFAFSVSVFQGQSRLDECPKLEREVIEQYSEFTSSFKTPESLGDEAMDELKARIATVDLSSAARRLGARYSGGRLTVKCLGKDFGVDSRGNIVTDIHVNPWLAIPFLDYVLNGKGISPTGNWMSFRELKDGKSRYPLFQKRCEEAMRRIADIYTDLFDDLAHLFDARRVERQFESDVSVVLHPLPKVPLMICYWAPEDGLGSNLNVFFDKTAVENLDIGSVFTLGAGLAQMFEKLALRHGFAKADFSD